MIQQWGYYMFKETLILLLFAGISMQALWAAYSLPPVEEQLILLLNLEDIELSHQKLNFSLNESLYQFPVNHFWMQDRIFSEGICTAINNINPKSSFSRVREIQDLNKKKGNIKLLVELISTSGSNDHYMVTYLKLFDPEIEYSRYFPKQEHYDTIRLPIPKATNSNEFTTQLKRISNTSREKIKLSLNNKPKRSKSS